MNEQLLLGGAVGALRGANLSPCTRYRYTLWRIWDAALPRLLFVMLNPSTADSFEDDATIRSCTRLARALGYGGIEVVNVYAYRATDPKGLVSPMAGDIVGPGNDFAIQLAFADLASNQGVVVCAWGSGKNRPADFAQRTEQIAENALGFGLPLMCLGKNQDGSPKHPLYLATSTQLEAWP